jgi:hypothetical protein
LKSDDDDDERIGCIDVVCKTALAHEETARTYAGEQKQTACDIPNANADYLPNSLPTRMFDMRKVFFVGIKAGRCVRLRRPFTSDNAQMRSVADVLTDFVQMYA